MMMKNDFYSVVNAIVVIFILKINGIIAEEIGKSFNESFLVFSHFKKVWSVKKLAKAMP